MSLYVRGDKEKVKNLRSTAESMGLEIVLYSEDPTLEIPSAQLITAKQSTIPLRSSIARAVDGVTKLFKEYGRAVSASEVSEETRITRSRASDYLNTAYGMGLIEKVPNLNKSVKGRYLFKPKD
jgi:hypothetical protein